MARLTTHPAATSRGDAPRITPTQWVVIAMLAGVAIGWLFPDGPTAGWFPASDLQVLSTMFLRLIKVLIAPLLFATLVLGVAGHGDDLKRVGTLAFRSMARTSLNVVGNCLAAVLMARWDRSFTLSPDSAVVHAGASRAAAPATAIVPDLAASTAVAHDIR